jgi:hypothetical protein
MFQPGINSLQTAGARILPVGRTIVLHGLPSPSTPHQIRE